MLQHDDSRYEKVRSKLLELVGGPNRDCGRATTTAEIAAATACAKDALSRGMPFIVQYQIVEIDVGGEIGLVRNQKGQILEVDYQGSGGKYKFETRTCGEKQLTDELDGALGCKD